jgi:hypothetical protein
MKTREELISMKPYEQKDIVFSNGLVKSTKTIEKGEHDNEYFVHSFTCGWLTAKMDLEQCIGYVEGTIDAFDLEWD